MICEVDIVRQLIPEIRSDQALHDTPVSDLLWGVLALVLEMYSKPFKLILVGYILWP